MPGDATGYCEFCGSVTDVVETVPWQSDVGTECPDPVEESTNGPHGPDAT